MTDTTAAPRRLHSAETRASSRPSTAGLGLARTGIELKQFFRERDSVVFTFLFPVILLFIFGSVFSDDIAPLSLIHI